jgi:monooxygenase
MARCLENSNIMHSQESTQKPMQTHHPSPSASPAPLDVLIVGAGLSGIGAARHLQAQCPDLSWAIVEARQALGGTWDLFRYPGVRSDSDMHTLGYSFKPWAQRKAIADGASILHYIQETADEAGISPKIRFGQTVKRAHWSSAQACWQIELQMKAAGDTV